MKERGTIKEETEKIKYKEKPDETKCETATKVRYNKRYKEK